MIDTDNIIDAALALVQAPFIATVLVLIVMACFWAWLGGRR